MQNYADVWVLQHHHIQLSGCCSSATSDPADVRGRGCGAHCVDASSAPSGLNAIAMVDRGGGVRLQYAAWHCRRKSPSAQPRSAARGSAAAGKAPAPLAHTRRPRGAASRTRSSSSALPLSVLRQLARGHRVRAGRPGAGLKSPRSRARFARIHGRVSGCSLPAHSSGSSSCGCPSAAFRHGVFADARPSAEVCHFQTKTVRLPCRSRARQ